MKSLRCFLLALLPALAFASSAVALSADENRDNAKPQFSDPGGQSPSRIVAQPGGSPYYQPSSIPESAFYSDPAKDSHVMSAYHPGDSHAQ